MNTWLIIAAAILVVAIVIIAVTGALGGGQGQVDTSDQTAFDSFLPLLIEAGSGTTSSLDVSLIPQTGLFKTLTSSIPGNIYINTDTVATTPDQIALAYEKGALVVKINGDDAKDAGYTYSKDPPTAVKQIYLAHTNSYTVIITFPQGQTLNSVDLTYMDYNKLNAPGDGSGTSQN